MSEIQYGKTGDVLKPLNEVVLADPRQEMLVTDTGKGYRPLTLEDYHARVSEFLLISEVPDDVRVTFETARNLYVYSWFVYRFGPVAEMQAYAALDYALTIRIGADGKKIKSLTPRMDYAIRKGWFRDEHIGFHRRLSQRRRQAWQFRKECLDLRGIDGFSELKEETDPSPDRYARVLQKTFPSLRNSLAHGEPTLGGGVLLTLDLCCDLINQLFAPQPGIASIPTT